MRNSSKALVALALLTFVPSITLWLPNVLLPQRGK